MDSITRPVDAVPGNRETVSFCAGHELFDVPWVREWTTMPGFRHFAVSENHIILFAVFWDGTNLEVGKLLNPDRHLPTMSQAEAFGVFNVAKQRKISIGVGVLVVHEGRFLVTRRRKGSSWGEGALAMPGGHIEENEKAYDCAVREVREEVGIDVRPTLIDNYTYILHAEEWFRQGKHHWTLYMPAQWVGGQVGNPEPHKHEDWRWATLDDVAALCKPTDWIPLPALVANRKKIGL